MMVNTDEFLTLTIITILFKLFLGKDVLKK